MSARLRQERRKRRLAPAMAAVTAGLAHLVQQHREGKVSSVHLLDGGTDVMAAGYASAMGAGSEDASSDIEDTPTVDFSEQAQQRAQAQQGYLMGLMRDALAAAAVGDLASRLGLYGQTLVGAYNAAYGQTVTTAHPTYEIVWELGATEKHCQPCISRAGKVFTVQTLPGWPGDGDFGGDICSGGPRCGCSLSYREGGREVASISNTQRDDSMGYYDQQNADAAALRADNAAGRAEFVSQLPSIPGRDGTSAQSRALDRDAIRQELADAANARERAAGGYQGVSTEPRDIAAEQVAQMLRERGKQV